MSLLPKGWAIAYLGDIAKWGAGGTPSRTNKSYYGGEIPWVKTGDLGPRYLENTSESITTKGLYNSSAKIFPKGSIAIAMYGATIGKTSILNISAATNQACAVATPLPAINKTFTYYLLKSEKEALIKKGKGGAQPNISQTVLKEHKIFLPPLNEQTRIANKLDNLLAKVDAAQARLGKIPTLLKRFRQSVLAAATSGELTRKGSSSNINLNWNSLSLENLAEVKDPHPSHRTPKIFEGGVPYIGIGDLNNDGSINFEKARKVSFDVLKEHRKRYQLKEGDFVFGKIGTLGRATPLPIDIDFTLSANTILIQPNLDIVNAKYLMFFLSAPGTMREIAKQANSTSQTAFGIKKMRAFVTRIPPLEEQQEIAHRVESLFALADNVEQQYHQAKQQVDKLTQSILAKAFRGELVPQDPNDEPASELLKHIQAERESQQSVKKTAKKKRQRRSS